MKHIYPTLAVGVGLLVSACASDDVVAPDAGTPVESLDGAVAQSDAGDVPPPAAFIVGLALNDAVDGRAPRGWPMLLMGVAALVEAVPNGVPLDAASLTLTIENANGDPEVWPLVTSTPIETVVLDDSREQADVTWGLTAAQTQALSIGRRTARVSWGGQSSASLEIDVVDLEDTTDPDVLAMRVRRLATLEARAALLRGDPNAALSALEPALANAPDDVSLLVWQGKAYDALGADADALASLDRAAAIVATATTAEPDVTVSQNRRPLLERLIQGAQ